MLSCFHCDLYDDWSLATCHPVESHLMTCLQQCLQPTGRNVKISPLISQLRGMSRSVLPLHLDFLQARGHTTTPEQELHCSKLSGYFCSRRNYYCMEEELLEPGADGGGTWGPVPWGTWPGSPHSLHPAPPCQWSELCSVGELVRDICCVGDLWGEFFCVGEMLGNIWCVGEQWSDMGCVGEQLIDLSCMEDLWGDICCMATCLFTRLYRV